MTPSATHTAVLACHPGTQSRAVHGIEARLSWEHDGALAITYVLKGELSRLRIPPPGPPRTRLRLALSAVIEEEDGVISFWALKHPPGKPDLHHPDAFALEIE